MWNPHRLLTLATFFEKGDAECNPNLFLFHLEIPVPVFNTVGRRYDIVFNHLRHGKGVEKLG